MKAKDVSGEYQVRDGAIKNPACGGALRGTQAFGVLPKMYYAPCWTAYLRAKYARSAAQMSSLYFSHMSSVCMVKGP